MRHNTGEPLFLECWCCWLVVGQPEKVNADSLAAYLLIYGDKCFGAVTEFLLDLCLLMQLPHLRAMANTSDVSMGLDLIGLESLFGGVSANGGV